LIDTRIYRTAFVLALLAFVVCMFSLEGRPRPLTSTLAPDAFDDQAASATTRSIVERNPDRRAGSPGDGALAALVEGRLENLGFDTSRDEFSAEVDGESTPLVNVVGKLPGPSEDQVVVLAHRDAAERPGASSAASTAVLLELARALAAVRHEKTLVFVSLDGGSADVAGARRFADAYPDIGKIEAALVVDDVGATRSERSSCPGRRTADADRCSSAAPRRLRSRVSWDGRPDPNRRSGSTCTRRGRSLCASRDRWRARSSTRSRSLPTASCRGRRPRTRS
jgi:hypothetical protein